MVRSGAWLSLMALALVACGGESQRKSSAATGASSGNGGTNAPGGSGGENASGGNGGTTVIPTTGGASNMPDLCEAWQEAPDAPTSCALVQDCPADLYEYLGTLGANLEYYHAEIGCGVTLVTSDSPIGTVAYRFDDAGKLVGYLLRQENDFGPCERSIYSYNADSARTCDDARSCAIAPDAADNHEVCACQCPLAPPEAGIAQTDNPSCVYEASTQCGPSLDGQRAITQSQQKGSVFLVGCGRQTLTTHPWGDDQTLECVYEDETLVGARREETGPNRDCDGVDVWELGVQYESCPDERKCWEGPGPIPDGLRSCADEMEQ